MFALKILHLFMTATSKEACSSGCDFFVTADK
jgi:hypothetical protein